MANFAVSKGDVWRWLCDETAVVGSRVASIALECSREVIGPAAEIFGGATDVETRRSAMKHLARDLLSVDTFASGLRLPCVLVCPLLGRMFLFFS